MNAHMTDYLLYAALGTCVMAVIITSVPVTGYLSLILLIPLLVTLLFAGTRPERAFYLICSGELLIIACTILNFWAGIFVVSILTAIICRVLGLLRSRQDLVHFAIFCGSSFLVALLINDSNHVLQPLLILACVCAIVLIIQSVRSYQFRKEFSGAKKI